jgi:hypothetical protein
MVSSAGVSCRLKLQTETLDFQNLEESDSLAKQELAMQSSGYKLKLRVRF